MTVSVPPLDIELPFEARGMDIIGAVAERQASLASASAPSRFLVDLLLLAKPGPFALEVEIKSDDRVVGVWNIEVNPRDCGGAYVSQAKANLYVCASARGDARATGAFLVVNQWWVNISNNEQLDQRYASLSAAVLERLESLLGGFANETGERRSCVLYLVDGRRLERKLLSIPSP
jgi:hypothetical protein